MDQVDQVDQVASCEDGPGELCKICEKDLGTYADFSFLGGAWGCAPGLGLDLESRASFGSPRGGAGGVMQGFKEAFGELCMF